MPKKKTQTTIDHDEMFETLQTRYTDLRDRKITVETQKTSVDEQLAALQAAAQEQFGTHDIEELKNQLDKMQAENEKKLTDYQNTLNKIDEKLAEIDNGLKESKASAKE